MFWLPLDVLTQNVKKKILTKYHGADILLSILIFYFETKILSQIAYLRFASTDWRNTLDFSGVLISELLQLCLSSQWSLSVINTLYVRVFQRWVNPVILYLRSLIFEVWWCPPKEGSWSNYLIHLDFKPVEQMWPDLIMPHSPCLILRMCMSLVMVSLGSLNQVITLSWLQGKLWTMSQSELVSDTLYFFQRIFHFPRLFFPLWLCRVPNSNSLSFQYRPL